MRIIYSSLLTDEKVNNTRKYLENEAYINGEDHIITDDEVFNAVHENDMLNYEDLLADLKRTTKLELTGYKILVEADLGLWNGRRQGAGIFDSLDAAVIEIVDDIEDIEVYTDIDGILKMKGYHHDGTNNYTFNKVLLDNVDEVKENIFELDTVRNLVEPIKDEAAGLIDYN